MRKLFRRDPWSRWPGLNRVKGIADLVVIAIVLASTAVVLGLNSVEVDEFLKWLKTIYGSLIVL